MNISELSESNYLKKDDVMPPISVTISGITKENMAKDGAPPEIKAVLHFSESVKPMVLNMTNAELIAHINGSRETNDWTGQKITLYNDPSISFAGQITGGIRVQIPVEQTPVEESENPADF